MPSRVAISQFGLVARRARSTIASWRGAGEGASSLSCAGPAATDSREPAISLYGNAEGLAEMCCVANKGRLVCRGYFWTRESLA